jgi:hypothetical protein
LYILYLLIHGRECTSPDEVTMICGLPYCCTCLCTTYLRDAAARLFGSRI